MFKRVVGLAGFAFGCCCFYKGCDVFVVISRAPMTNCSQCCSCPHRVYLTSLLTTLSAVTQTVDTVKLGFATLVRMTRVYVPGVHPSFWQSR